MATADPDRLPKDRPPKTIPFGVRVSTREFGETPSVCRRLRAVTVPILGMRKWGHGGGATPGAPGVRGCSVPAGLGGARSSPLLPGSGRPPSPRARPAVCRLSPHLTARLGVQQHAPPFHAPERGVSRLRVQSPAANALVDLNSHACFFL